MQDQARLLSGRAHWSFRRYIFDTLRVVSVRLRSRRIEERIRRFRDRRTQEPIRNLLRIYNEQGMVAVLEDLQQSMPRQRDRIKALMAIVRYSMNVNVLDAERAIRKLVSEASDRLDIRKWASLAAWDSGNIRFAHKILAELVISERESYSVAEKVRQIQGSWQLFQELPKVPNARPTPAYDCKARNMLYVASSSRPYHITGYTCRTHHILRAIKASEWDVHCVTRPGYPLDRPDAREVSDQLIHAIDGLVYERLPGAHRREVKYDEYLMRSVGAVEKAAIRLKPAVIQAASNYEAAIPALFAARRLGIPFVYEVRGFWEYTAASKKPGWEYTQRFELDRRLESLAVSNADHVFTLTSAMADELVERGANADRISLAPNGIEPSAFTPLERDRHLAVELNLPDSAFVVGYVGSIVTYEGLDDLISAAGMLTADFPNLRLVIVGDGDARGHLEQLVLDKSLKGFVTFTGKVAPSAVARYFSLFNAMALPRKPYQVCRLVSPLKPLEAMAMNVPMIVSDVEALQEMVTDQVSALVHTAGDVESLADAIRLLISAPDLATELTENARAEMLPARTWDNIAHEMVRVLDRIS